MKNTAKTALLLGILSALLLIVGQTVGGQQGLIVAFGFAALLNLGSYWFSDKLVLKMYRAKEVGPEHPLSRIVLRLAQRAGLPSPKVYTIPTDALNAFATGRNPEHAAVAATDGIIANLSERELEGVMAHELAHVKNRDTLISAVAATIAAAIMMLAYIARWGAIFGGLGGRDNDRGGGALGPGRFRNRPRRVRRRCRSCAATWPQGIVGVSPGAAVAAAYTASCFRAVSPHVNPAA